MVGAVVWMWSARDWVTEAYTSEHESVDLQLGGLDLTAEVADAGPSPFVIATAPDTRDVVLVEEVAQPTASAVELGGGNTRFSGVVTEVVDGAVVPAVGATVSIERVTIDGTASAQLSTGTDGSFAFTGLLGGSYRVRAYMPGVSSSGPAVVRFVADGSANDLQFALSGPNAAVSLDLVGPPEISTAAPATVAVVASAESVDQLGRFVRVPISGVRVSLSGSSAASIVSADQVFTDSGGAARFLISCDVPGIHTVRASTQVVSNDPEAPSRTVASQFSLPTCVTPPPPPPEVTNPPEGGADPAEAEGQ